jgi:type I restriction enzyme, S subunit
VRAARSAPTLFSSTGTRGFICDGDWVETKDQDPQGEVRLIQLADIGVGEFLDKSNRRLRSETARRLKCTFLEPGDILIARMPDPIGRACIFPGDSSPCATVVDVCILRADPKVTNSSWLKHYLNSPQFSSQVRRFIRGSTRPRISRANLQALKIPRVTLSEQARIARSFDCAQSARNKKKQALSLIQYLCRSVFLSMFGEPQSNPLGWKRRPLENLLEIEWGNTSITKRSYVSSGVPAYSASGHDGFLPEGEHTGEGIVLSAIGARCGKCFYVPGGSWTAIKNTITLKPRVDIRDLELAYVYSIINDESFWPNHGAGQPFITLQTARRQMIPVPPIRLQREYARILESCNQVRSGFENSMSELDKLLESMQRAAFGVTHIAESRAS